MKRATCIGLVSLLSLALPLFAVDSGRVKRVFADPPREYATAPLWVWNDLLTETQVRQTLRDLARQNVRQVFVHPRPGLMTPYLSDEWFRLWKVALAEAKRRDMNIWIYDENSYPSGFAGGWVPELMPESRGRGLAWREVKAPPAASADLLAVFRLAGDEAEPVTAQVRAGEVLSEGRYLAAFVQRSSNSPWHGNRSYVDLLYPGVTEKFLEVTLEAYRREVGREFGRRIPGVFTDEPNITPAGGLPWTDDLPQQFQQRRGYDLLDRLAGLRQEVGDWRKVRHDYYQTLLELFIERWARPVYDYCARHDLEFTGHYWEHEWPNCVGVPDNMAMAAWQQRPGIDTLMNQYAEDTHAQFGNVRACREISSLANQLGRARTLVELYGAGGWDLRFEDMKRIGDWLEVLGVNTLDEHLSYITLRGARKRDHPQSFSYHEPWWEAYHVSATYFTRLSAALTQGEQIHRVLVLEPTTTAWMYQGHARLKEVGDAFFRLLLALEAAQVEYDLGCEDVLARQGAIDGPELRVGRRSYPVVVLPPLTENLDGPTASLLAGLLRAGGAVVACDEPPARIDGVAASQGLALATRPNWTRVAADAIVPVLRKWTEPEGFDLQREAGDRGVLFHHRRHLADGQLLFLVNTSLQAPARGRLRTRLHGVERWDLWTGRPQAYAFQRTDAGVEAQFDLPPCGSLLLFLSQKPLKPARPMVERVRRLAAAGPLTTHRLGPNVLTLDYVDITAGGETRTDQYFYQANQFAFQKNGMDRNPWDSAVQFRDELIARTFPPDSGFEARYRFVIEGAVPPSLALVIERPDLYTLTCNGQPIRARSGDWWLDRAFGRIDLAGAARPGENVVVLEARPFTIQHELEPAYVLGDFALRAGSRGFVIIPDRSLKLGPWNEQGQPFYSAGVAYRQSFQLAAPAGRYRVTLPAWYGSVAKVKVNRTDAGYVTCAPWQCEVTDLLQPGDNTLEVQVIGTLKNTLGPHHGKPGLGSAWPGMFQRGPIPGPPPGGDYHTVGYGLFEPWVLEQVMAEPRVAATGR